MTIEERIERLEVTVNSMVIFLRSTGENLKLLGEEAVKVTGAYEEIAGMLDELQHMMADELIDHHQERNSVSSGSTT